jgi:hypothetical protein
VSGERTTTDVPDSPQVVPALPETLDAAAVIVEDAFSDDFTYPCDLPRDIAVALHRAGWLHDPSTIAQLRAVADAVKTALVEGYPLHPDVRKAYGAIVVAHLSALDQP